MNQDRVEGNWLQFKGKVKEQWGKLTDDVTGQAYALDYAPWHEFREVYT